MSTPAESAFLVIGNVITKPRNNLSPTTTKMLAVVKNNATKIRLCDAEPDIESGDTNIDDDLDARAEITRDIDDNCDDIMEKDYEDCDSNCFLTEGISVIAYLSFSTKSYILNASGIFIHMLH